MEPFRNSNSDNSVPQRFQLNEPFPTENNSVSRTNSSLSNSISMVSRKSLKEKKESTLSSIRHKITDPFKAGGKIHQVAHQIKTKVRGIVSSNKSSQEYDNQYISENKGVETSGPSVMERVNKAMQSFSIKEGMVFNNKGKPTGIPESKLRSILTAAFEIDILGKGAIFSVEGRSYSVFIEHKRGVEKLHVIDLTDRQVLGQGSGQTAYRIANLTRQKASVMKKFGSDFQGRMASGEAVIAGAKILQKIHADGVKVGIEKPPKLVFDLEGNEGYITSFYNSGSVCSFDSQSVDRRILMDGVHQLLRGFSTLEEAGVYHVDIKDDNTLIHKKDDGTYRFDVADFDNITTREEVLNKPNEMGPLASIRLAYFPTGGERLKNLERQNAIDTGMILFRLLTGVLPTLEGSNRFNLKMHPSEKLASIIREKGYEENVVKFMVELLDIDKKEGMTTREALAKWEEIFLRWEELENKNK